MKTLLSWFIANIGGIVDFFIVTIYEILLFNGHIPFGNSDLASMALAGLLLPLFHGIFVGGYPSKNIIGDVFNICILTIGYLVAFGLKDNPEYTFLSIYMWGIMPSAVLAILIAIFAAYNMDEVVSRRMLYTNSNANMFEMTLLYTINRFVAAFSAFSFIFLAMSLWKKFII